MFKQSIKPYGQDLCLSANKQAARPWMQSVHSYAFSLSCNCNPNMVSISSYMMQSDKQNLGQTKEQAIQLFDLIQYHS